MSVEPSYKIESFLDMDFSDFLWVLLYVILMFGSSIQTYTGFAYVDEIAACVLIIAAGWKLVGGWFRKELVVPVSAVISLVSFAFLVLCGVMCNFLYGYQTRIPNIIIDIFTCLKFPIILLCSMLVFARSGKTIVTYIEGFARVLAIFLACLALLNLIVDFGMGTDPRFGLRASFLFICGHPAYLALLCLGLFLVFVRNLDRNKFYVFLTVLVMASTLRSKALAFCVVGPAIIYFMRSGRKLNLIHILLIVLVGAAIGWDQMTAYYQTDGSARAEITRASLRIARDFFPVGTGFASFGSVFSAQGSFYSPVYYEYGLNEVWGLSPDDTFFLSDTFWPTVLGQFGVLGLLLYLVGTGSVLVLASSHGQQSRMVVACCLAYYLIESSSASALFNPTAVYIGMSLGIVVSSLKEDAGRSSSFSSAVPAASVQDGVRI